MNLAELKREHEAGMSPTRIGIRQGISPKKVREILACEGYEVSEKRWQPDTTERDVRIRKMLEDKRTVRVIVEAVGCSAYAVTEMRRTMKGER